MGGVEQRAQRGGWMQEQSADGGFGDQQHSVTGREAAPSAHADREAQISVIADAGRPAVVRDDEDGAGDQGQGERVPGPQCRARSTVRSARRPYRSRIAMP